jgi:hypothetical protein
MGSMSSRYWGSGKASGASRSSISTSGYTSVSYRAAFLVVTMIEMLEMYSKSKKK